VFHAFSWSKSKGMLDLGTLPGDLSSLAAGINSRGQIVGASCTDAACANPSAFLIENGVMTDLNTLVSGSNLFLVWALDINSRGQIVGLDFDSNTQQAHAFLLMPCDEEIPDFQECKDAAGTKNSMATSHVALPDHVRTILRERLSRYRRPDFEAPMD
jgi:probable HAF family extracellular repeat protein